MSATSHRRPVTKHPSTAAGRRLPSFTADRPHPGWRPSVPLGLDYSAGVIAPETILADGYDTVFRYVDTPTLASTPKHITPDEYTTLTNGGITVYLVFEVGTQDWTGGFDAGVSNAARAQAGARWVGYTGLIFATVDTHPDMTPTQVTTAMAYVAGFEQGLGHQAGGAYGFCEIIAAAQAAGIGAAYWQCGHKPDPNAGVHVWQDNTGVVTVGGVTCDINHLLLPIPGAAVTMQQQIADIWAQIMGPWAPWAGGYTDDNNTPYTVVQFVLRDNVTVTQQGIELADLTAKVAALQTSVNTILSTLHGLGGA